jgi:hypothetical protein
VGARDEDAFKFQPNVDASYHGSPDWIFGGDSLKRRSNKPTLPIINDEMFGRIWRG